MTGVELELISDIDMNLFIEKAIRGGISYIAKRYSKANNKHMKLYEDSKPSKYITYSWHGYILKADLEYPDKLHELHNDYPLASEKINRSMLSEHCSNIANQYSIKVSGVNKLVPNLSNKNKYVLHYRNLQQYQSLGMKLIRIHRILKFKQSDWLKTTLILILVKERILSLAFKKTFLN